MEVVFHISYCPNNCRVKYATYTLMDSALTWWNNHAKSIGINEAYAMWLGTFEIDDDQGVLPTTGSPGSRIGTLESNHARIKCGCLHLPI